MEILKKKDKVSLEEFYLAYPNKNSIRGMINALVKTGEIKRLEKGVYGISKDQIDSNSPKKKAE